MSECKRERETEIYKEVVIETERQIKVKISKD